MKGNNKNIASQQESILLIHKTSEIYFHVKVSKKMQRILGIKLPYKMT